MNQGISKKTKSLLSVSLCCAISLQNVTTIGNAKENTLNVEQIDSNSSKDIVEKNSNVSDTEAFQADPGRPNMGGTDTSRNSSLKNLDIVKLTNPNAIGSGKVRDTDTLNVRSGPSTSYENMGTLNEGDTIEVLGISNGWYKIDFKGKDGYISPTYITLNALDKGIDVSKWNGTIDWQKVKESGVSYAIIRAGYGSSTVDPNFHANIQGALNAGLKVGVYWFSYATSIEKAQIEAQKCLEELAPYKGKLAYPVFFDYEYDSVEYAKKQNITITKDLATQMAKSFMNSVKSQGYITGIYTNKDFSSNYFSNDLLYSSTVWSAQYSSKNTFNKPYSMWQYTENGVVPGISGGVDLNYTTLKTFNVSTPADPSKPEIPAPTPSEIGVTTANLNMRTGPSTNESLITTIPSGNKIEIIDKSISGWYKIKYKDKTGYVSSQYVKIGDTTIPTPPPAPVETGVTTANLNMRTGPSTNESLITTISSGTKIEVIDKSISGWYKIKYKDKTGYVSSQYVKIGDTSIPTPAPPSKEVGITTANLNLRTSASTSTSSTIITTIPKGAQVEIIDKSTSGWYKVKYSNKTGYVSSQYVTLNGGTVTPPPPPVTNTGTTTDNVNLRTGPSTSLSIIMTIKKGSKVEILDKSNTDWYKIKYNGNIGYVSSQYIK